MIVLGKVVEPYGIAGWVRVHPFADDFASWAGLSQWWLAACADQTSGEQWSARPLEQTRITSGKLLAKFSGVDDRSGAERLKGWFVAAPRDALPDPKAGEYYWDDLISLRVVNLQGESLGTVVEMLATGANDVMVVQDGELRRLIPFLAHVIHGVRLGERQIEVDWGQDW